jgi:hypothetical protein
LKHYDLPKLKTKRDIQQMNGDLYGLLSSFALFSTPEVLVAADAADATVVVNTLIILWCLNARPGRWREATL